MDTIGAILIRKNENKELDIWMASSSGGPWLKQSGRIGSVIIY